MAKKRLVLKVSEGHNGQKRITIPPDSKIEGGDYVEVKKLGDAS